MTDMQDVLQAIKEFREAQDKFKEQGAISSWAETIFRGILYMANLGVEVIVPDSSVSWKLRGEPKVRAEAASELFDALGVVRVAAMTLRDEGEFLSELDAYVKANCGGQPSLIIMGCCDHDATQYAGDATYNYPLRNQLGEPR